MAKDEKETAKKPAAKKAAKKPAKKPVKKPAKEAPVKDAAVETPTPVAPQPAPAQEQIPEPMLRILAQYTKDASFENPNAPESLRSELGAPEISINIEIGRQMVDNNTGAEVVLMLSAHAQREGKSVFLCELEYAGLFSFAGIPEEHILPMIMIECPRLLFPFARQIMAEMTQNGGFPPIMLEPPDFAAMFREEMMRRAAQQGESATFN